MWWATQAHGVYRRLTKPREFGPTGRVFYGNLKGHKHNDCTDNFRASGWQCWWSAASQRPQSCPLIALSVAIIVGGIGVLMSDSSGFEYYKHVDEVAKEGSIWQNKRLQLHGYVVPGTIKSA